MYVTGPAHLFVGVPLWAYGTLSQPSPNAGPNQRELRSVPGGVYNDAGQLIGGTIENQQRPAPQIEFLGFQPVYLGTAEKSPKLSHSPVFVPWRDDEASSQLPADELYDGETATVTADLTRWWENVYRFLSTRVKAFPLGGRAGVDFAGAVGTSMTWELQNHPLWVQFPYAAKAVHGLRGLPPGVRYWQAKLVAPDDADDLGHLPMRRRLTWLCTRYHDLPTGAAVLYDFDMAGLPRVN